MSLSALSLDCLAEEEVEALVVAIDRQALDLPGLARLESTIQRRWAELTAVHPELEQFTNSTTSASRLGTEEFHRAFLGGFPDLPDRPFTWLDEDLIYGAFQCVLDHASVTALIEVAARP